MRNSLLEIISKNSLLKNQIFEFQFDKILTKLPDRKARLQNLELLYDGFIPIYKKIITQISFENKYIKSKILILKELFFGMKPFCSHEILKIYK